MPASKDGFEGGQLPVSLARLLLDHPARPSDPLVSTIDTEISSTEFRLQAGSVSEQFRDLGVRPGQSVAVQLPSGPDMAAGMFGAWLAGAVFVPVNSRQPQLEVDRMLDAVRPAALLDTEGTHVLDAPSVFDPDVAFVTWTSGTTGPPKPILQTHSGYREILGRVLSTIRKGPATESPAPNLVPVSLALNAGIYNALFGFMAGASIVLMERFDPRDFAELVRRYGVRSTVLPPAALNMLTAEPSVYDLTPLRYVRSITAPLSPLAARRFMDKFGVTVLNGYGQAEVGEVIGWTAADARAHPDKLGAVGRAHPGVDIRILDDEGLPVPPGTSGQLFVRPPRMASGYAGDDSLGSRIDADGYLRTGDFATMDADGFVWIEGRSTDLINRGGNKVFPDQVEEVLLLSASVQETAVVGVPDARMGEVPIAFVVGEATDDELVALCRANLVPYKIPVAFVRVPKIPRNEVGKVLRRDLAVSWAQSSD
jgi:acyl-coenzyme A synthetase/AMP-(fatty) acid ligase